MALTETQIQELYVAYFGRPADPDGKDYWMSSAAGAPTDRAFASHMHGQAEFQDAYGSMTTQAQVNQLYQNLFNRDGDAAGLAYWTGEVTKGNLKLAEIAVNLIHAAKNPISGNTTQGAADALALENKVAAAIEFTGDVKYDDVAFLAYTSDDANAFDSAKTFINGITSTAATATEIDNEVISIKDYYNENTANKGTTYALTTGSDTFTGSRLNDTFNGLVDSDSDSGETFTAADTIDGGAGTDTLAWTIDVEGTASNAIPGAAISNVEVFKVRNIEGAAVTLDMSAFTGETKAVVNLSTSGVTWSNAAIGTELEVLGNSSLSNGASAITYVGGTASTVTVKGGVTGGAITVDDAGDTIKTQTINSTGGNNTTGNFTVAGGTTAVTIDATTTLTLGSLVDLRDTVSTLTVTGTGAVSTGTADGINLVNIDASGNSGGLTHTTATLIDSTPDTTTNDLDDFDITITGGSGADSITLADVNDSIETSVSLGAGNDGLTIAEGVDASTASNNGDVFNGGAGTDTLTTTQALATAQSAVTTVSNFEVLKISDVLDGAITPGNFQSGLTAQLNAGFNSGTVTFATGGGTVNFTGSTAGAGALTVVASGDSTTDTVTLNNNADSVDIFGGQDISATEVETLVVTTTGVDGGGDGDTTSGIANTIGAITLSVDTDGASLVKFEGAEQITSGVITADTINASGLTGTTGFSNTGAAAVTLTTNGTLTVTGSAGTDVIVGDTNDSNVIDGGAGNDTITGGDEVDVLTGGAGNDTITMGGTVASTVSGGAGNDTVVAAGNTTYGQTITGGDGTDTFKYTTTNITSANGSVVSGFEVLQATSGLTVDLGNFGNNTFTSINVDNVATTITGHKAETITIDATMTAALSITADTAASVTTDSITINSKVADAGNSTGTITLANIETVTITTNDTEDAGYETADYKIVANSATTLTITGDSGIDFEEESSSLDSLITLDASGMTNTDSTEGIIFTSQNATVGAVTNYTGSAAADTFTGLSTSDDTFSGGAGVDTLVYAGRTDTFTGGAGNDVFDIDALGTNTGSAYLCITDLTVGDTINFADVDAGTDADGGIADVTVGAKHTLGSSATLANYLDAACATAINNTTDTMIDWFQFGGNTYITIDNSVETTYYAGQDGLIKLTGEIDLSTSTIASAVLTVVAV